MTDPYRRNPEDIALADGHEERRARVKKQLAEAMQKKKAKQSKVSTQPEPRYDDVYHEGMAWLDGLEEEDEELLKLCPKCGQAVEELCDHGCPGGSPPKMPEIVSGSLSAGVPEGDGDYTVWPRMERKIDRIREEGLG